MGILDGMKKNKKKSPGGEMGASSGLSSLKNIAETKESANPFTVEKPKLDLMGDVPKGHRASKDNITAKADPDDPSLTDAQRIAILEKQLTPKGVQWPRKLTDKTSDAHMEPEALTILGQLNDPLSGFKKFGYWQHDRALHTHIVGESGGGKSTLIKSIFYQDMYAGRGGMLIDPHGDVAEESLERVPPWRMHDVVYLDFTNKENFIGLNALETFSGSVDEKQMVSEGVISLLHKQFGGAWGPNLENNLRHALLTLVDTPGMTILDVDQLFLDAVFRGAVKKNIVDRAIQSFWEQNYETKSAAEQAKGTASVSNKIRQYIANNTLRCIVGQGKTTINFAELMDEGAIIIVNLSKGHTSELVSNFVGSVLVSKVLAAALSRQGRVEEKDRRRFHLIIDEFQNFVTDDFATILSEARKYGLALTVAHQNMGQLEELKAVRNSLENNVQNRLIYGVGNTDARYFEKFFEPHLSYTDLANLPAYHIAVKIRENRQKGKPFTAKALPPIGKMETSDQIRDFVYQRSIEKYTRKRDEVEAEFLERMEYGKRSNKDVDTGGVGKLL